MRSGTRAGGARVGGARGVMLTLGPVVMPPAHTIPFPALASTLAEVSPEDARTIPLGLLLALDPHARFAADGIAVRRGQTVQEFAAERRRWIASAAPWVPVVPVAEQPAAPARPAPTAPQETGEMLDPIEALIERVDVEDEPDELLIARLTGVRGVQGPRGGGW